MDVIRPLAAQVSQGSLSMVKPEIIGSIRSTYTRVVRLVCEEKAIDHTLTEVMLDAPELFAIHPLGKMPVLRHGDFTLFESKAIATYLDRSFAGPTLIPDDPRLCGLTEQWVSFVNTAVDRALVRTYLLAYVAAMQAGSAPDRKAIDAALIDVRKQVEILDRAVAATGFLVGNQLTLADLNLLPILDRFRTAPEGGQLLASSVHLSHYFATHAARPSMQKTVFPAGVPRRATTS
jgi:glutathione S-transferase